MNEADWVKKIWHVLDEQPNIKLLTGVERRLWDKTRVDILTDSLAIEVDWVQKWPEAIGQSCWYAINTSRQPGICLLVEDFTKQARFIYRAQVVIERYNIILWLVDTTKSVLYIAGHSINI